MPQNEKRIQVGDLSHEIDASKAQGSFVGMPGKLVVEMLPPPKHVGVLLMPDKVSANVRSDVGVVLSPQFETHVQGQRVRSPRPGTLVCVEPYDGLWIDAPELDGYATENQVRIYGHFCQHQGEPIACDWWLSVLCEIDSMTKVTVPTGDRIVFRPDPTNDVTEGGIFLLDRTERGTAMGTVVAAGPLAFDLEPGDRICYDPRATRDERYGFDLCDELKDLFVMGSAGVMYRLPRETEKTIHAEPRVFKFVRVGGDAELDAQYLATAKSEDEARRKSIEWGAPEGIHDPEQWAVVDFERRVLTERTMVTA